MSQHIVYTIIFEGCKFRGFRCKLVEREILIFEKKQWLKETLSNLMVSEN